jgi:hypothetical protein
MSEFHAAMLLRIRCEMEALVSKRLGMIAANNLCAMNNVPPIYDQDAFEDNARSLYAIAPDPHGFA